MSKRQVLMLLGVLIMILPYLGFPEKWDEFLLIVIGLVVIAIAYRSKIVPIDHSLENKTGAPFVDHHSPSPAPPAPTQTPPPVQPVQPEHPPHGPLA